MASPSLTDLNGAVTVSPQLEQSSPKSSETTSTCECSALHTINTSLSLLLHVNISCPCDPVPEEGPSIEGLSTSPKATIGECLLVCVCLCVCVSALAECTLSSEHPHVSFSSLHHPIPHYYF